MGVFYFSCLVTKLHLNCMPSLQCLKADMSLGSDSKKDVNLIQRYKDVRILGSGEISQVILANDTTTSDNKMVAVKKIKKSNLTPVLLKKLNTEVVILKQLSVLPFDCFVKLYDVLEDNQYIYLIMEYISGGELFDLVEQFPLGIPEIIAKKILKQIFTAISHLHKLDIAHLDLKLENIMYNPTTETIKIIDFGYASRTDEKLQEYSGSIHYIAPQLLNKIPYDAKKADMWSLGVISYALLAAKFPFDDENDNHTNIFFQIKRGMIAIPPHFSSQAKNFVETILNPNEIRRPSVEDMLGHQFLTSTSLR